MSNIILQANKDLNGNYVTSKYWKVGAESTSEFSGDNLYVGTTSSYINRRSRIVFYPNSYTFLNQTITSVTLKVKTKKLFSSSEKTQNTNIRISSTNTDTDSAYNNSSNCGIIAAKSEGEKTFSFTGSYLTQIVNWCKNGTPFSVFFGIDSNNGNYGLQYYGYKVTGAPTLEIEYIPSISTATITGTPKIGTNFTININRSSTNYTHTVTISSGSASKVVENAATSATFYISESETKNWISSTSKTGTVSCKVVTYYNGSNMGEYSFSFTLTIKDNFTTTWSTKDIVTSHDWAGGLISGYSIPSISLKAETIDGSTISKYRVVSNNSCGITIDTYYAASSLSNQSLGIKPYSSIDSNFSITVYAINSRGIQSRGETLSIKCLAYSLPSTILNIKRAKDTSGTEDLMGTYLYNNTNYIYTSLNNNNSITANPTISIKDSLGRTYSYTSLSDLKSKLHFYVPNTSSETEYTVSITITDRVASNTIISKVPSSNFIIHVKKGGKSLGIGSAADNTDGTIKLGWKLLVNNGIEFSNYTNGVLPVTLGGTGVSSMASLKTALGIDNLNYLPSSGGTINGNLTVNGTLTAGSKTNAITLTGSSFTYNGKNIVTLDDLNNELYYKTNTTITLTSGVFFGYVTSSTTEIRIVIPLKKRLDNITNVNFSNFKCVIRNIDGYAIQTSWSNEADYDYKDYITDKNINIENQSIVVQLKRDSAWKLRNNGTLSATASNIIFTLT